MFVVIFYAHQSYFQGENKNYESFQSLSCILTVLEVEEEQCMPVVGGGSCVNYILGRHW